MEHSQKHVWLQYTILLIICTLVSLPISQAGFFGDDIVNSVLKGNMQSFHLSLPVYILLQMKIWLAYGRVFPLSVISSTSIFYFFYHLPLYQWVRIFFIWTSIFCFAGLIRQFSKELVPTFLFVLLVPLCWSIRDFPDPLTSYAIFLPLTAIFMALTGWAYLRNAHRFSLIMFFCALCSYEIGVAAFFLIALIIWLEKKPFKDLLPYGLLLVFYILLNVWIRHGSNGVYEGIRIHAGAQFWTAFKAQWMSGLPLSYYLFSADRQEPIFDLLKSLNIGQITLAGSLFLLAAGSFFGLLQNLKINKKTGTLLVLSSVILTVWPALLIALSEKYQSIIQPGRGYIPVYFQYLGMGFLFLALLGYIENTFQNSRLKLKFNIFLAGILALVLTLATLLDTNSVESLNDKYSNHRNLVENALRHSFLNTLPAQSFLVEKENLWNTQDFYQLNARQSLGGIIDIYDHKKLQSENNKYLLWSYNLPHSQSGFVILGKITNIEFHPGDKFIYSEKIALAAPSVFIAAKNASEKMQIEAVLNQVLPAPLAAQKYIFNWEKMADIKV